MEDLPEAEIFRLSSGLFLEDIEEEYLEGSPQEIWGEMDSVEDLEKIEAGLFDAVWDMREEQLKLLRLRHSLYRENPALYAYAWFLCVPAMELGAFFKEWQENKALRRLGRMKSSWVPTSPQSAKRAQADAAVEAPKMEQTGGLMTFSKAAPSNLPLKNLRMNLRIKNSQTLKGCK